MSQKWINNIPEVAWHGNNGSQIVPDAAASARYTEARLSKVIEEGMFAGIKKNNVNMIWNYSEDEQWPEVLPAILPRLMINGCQGIGSTIANVWLPHSLTDVAAVLNKYIDTGVVDYSNLYPDFPTGCQIINKNDIHSIYRTGKGKAVLRARADIKGKHIYFRELPYQVYVEPLIEKIKELAEKEEISGIDAVYNRSSKKGIEIDIECTAAPESILPKLYQKTDLQKSYSANQWALVGKTPMLLTLEDYCRIYLSHNVECLVKELTFDLDKAKARLHIVEGLLIALEDIDNVIALIKKSDSAAAAKEDLMKKYNLSEAQSKSILAMRLSSLAKLEKLELENEKKELIDKISDIENILLNKDRQLSIIKERLETIVKKYGEKRKTELTHIEIKPEEKELEPVIPEDCVVVVAKNGDIKRVPTSSFKVQKTRGKGVKSENETILDRISTNTIDTLMIFTTKGKMYRLLVDNVPVGTNTSKGTNIGTLISLDIDEKVAAITSLNRKTNAEFVIFITKNGLIKKTLLSEYMKIKRSTGIQAINIKEGDAIANVTFVKDEDLILITQCGMAIHFSTKDINPIGRAAAGVKGIKLNDEDSVITGLPIHKDTDSLAIFTSLGYGKQIGLDKIPIQGRGGKGLIVQHITQGEEIVAGAAMIDEKDTILLSGKPNSICISAQDIPKMVSRVGVGNKMIKNSKIISIVKL